MRTVVCSGYYNPLHAGHIEYLRAASELGDRLVVIVNNDRQVDLKGTVPFMDEDARLEVVAALRWVDDAQLSIDEDLTVCESLRECYHEAQGEPNLSMIFANGGDVDEVREAGVCMELGIEIVKNVGGEKIESSSDLLHQVAA